jgi:sialate O-acetylesterase
MIFETQKKEQMNLTRKFTLIAAATFPTLASCEVKMPAVFNSHMVLQRDSPLKVWGSADPGEKVVVSIGGSTSKTTADGEGQWAVEIPAMKDDGGKPHQLKISGTNEIVIEDVLIGDVWIGSGQSNMEWSLKGSAQSDEFIAKANHDKIRLFHIPKVKANAPTTDVKATWKTCNSANVPNFSAVLYHFGRRLHKESEIPIGLINSSWGGSPIEPWIVGEKSSGEMYNGMIAPITQFGVRGTIWYQGETNVINKNGLSYTGKMKDLIEGWRRVFENKDMPFYFVQIAPWGNTRYADGELPSLWEAQCATLKIPNTGMVVTTDLVDNIEDIHPRNKHDVGARLARWSLARDYGKKDVIVSGPLYKRMKAEGSKIRLEFAHTAKGLKSSDKKPLSEFQIAGADGNFVSATAVISDNSVLVSAEGVKSPKQVRFGWHRSANPNLVNTEGLPASPFQTKNWTGGTGE